jgi:hypothetical protein
MVAVVEVPRTKVLPMQLVPQVAQEFQLAVAVVQ